MPFLTATSPPLGLATWRQPKTNPQSTRMLVRCATVSLLSLPFLAVLVLGPAAEAAKRYGVKVTNPELIEAMTNVDETKIRGERESTKILKMN